MFGKIYIWVLFSIITTAVVVAVGLACAKQGVEKNDEISGNVEGQAVDSITSEITVIYEKDDRCIYLSKDSDSMVRCYTQEGDGTPQKVVFNHVYGEDGFPIMYYHCYGDNVYVIGDFLPNSNGWTIRCPVYLIDGKTLKMRFVDEGAGVHFDTDWFKIAKCRLTNEDEATCTAEEKWVWHYRFYTSDGKKIRDDKKEYNWETLDEAEKEAPLVNADSVACFNFNV